MTYHLATLSVHYEDIPVAYGGTVVCTQTRLHALGEFLIYHLIRLYYR